MEIAIVFLITGSLVSLAYATGSFVRSSLECNRRDKEASLKRSAFATRITLALGFVADVVQMNASGILEFRVIFLICWTVGIVGCMIAYELDKIKWDIIQIICWPVTLLLTGYRKITKV